MPRSRFLMLTVLVPAIVIAFFAGAMTERAVRVSDPPRPPRDAAPDASSPDFALIREAWTVIERQYVDRSALKPGALTAGAISGMVNALGDTDHSVYLTPDMVREERSLLSGEYVGVGLEITEDGGRVVIVAPIDGSPAIQAGLHRGEQILRVNDQSVDGLGVSQVVRLIVGPAGTSVRLSVYDPATGATSVVSLRRERIRVHSVSWETLPGSRLADIRVATFGSGVARELTAALRKIEDAKIQGIILDLRNNPGGELEEAVNTASQFLAHGDVLQEKDAQGGIIHDKVHRGGVATTLPVVVLIDGGTASGAEIVAGALQNAHRATLVGETTFGTGTVLSDFPLSDGSALLLAVKEWLTPAGQTVWHKGITPDVRIALSADAGLLTPESLRGMSRQALEASTDVQLRKALDILDAQRKRRP